MQIFFSLFLPTISQAIQCNKGLKLRESASQCWDKNILQTRPKDIIMPRTALASLPGNYYMSCGVNRSSLSKRLLLQNFLKINRTTLFSSKSFPLISAGPQKPQKLTASNIKYEKFGPKRV